MLFNDVIFFSVRAYQQARTLERTLDNREAEIDRLEGALFECEELLENRHQELTDARKSCANMETQVSKLTADQNTYKVTGNG